MITANLFDVDKGAEMYILETILYHIVFPFVLFSLSLESTAIILLVSDFSRYIKSEQHHFSSNKRFVFKCQNQKEKQQAQNYLV